MVFGWIFEVVLSTSSIFILNKKNSKDPLVLAPATETDGAVSSAAPAGRTKPPSISIAVATPDASPAGQVLETTP